LGRQSSGATIAAIYQAFLGGRRTWAQAELARHAGVGVPALRKRLQELQDQGTPLESEADGNHIYWSVPRGWFPGGV
jgi:transcription initiation factor TFIIIB Brf1 subunit/transcription initiation factor TFIIB